MREVGTRRVSVTLRCRIPTKDPRYLVQTATRIVEKGNPVERQARKTTSLVFQEVGLPTTSKGHPFPDGWSLFAPASLAVRDIIEHDESPPSNT